MALKEMDNEVRMFGVLPAYGAKPIPVGRKPDDSSQVAFYAYADNSDVSIYKVPASETLYLSHFSFSIYNTHTGAGGGRLYIKNDTPAMWNELYRMIVPTVSGFAVSGFCLPPMELGGDFEIFVQSWQANTTVMGFIHGYRI